VEEDVEAHRRPQPGLGAGRGVYRPPQALAEVVKGAVEDGEEDLLLGGEAVVEAGLPYSDYYEYRNP
jgi:hypothetical protein